MLPMISSTPYFSESVLHTPILYTLIKTVGS